MKLAYVIDPGPPDEGERPAVSFARELIGALGRALHGKVELQLYSPRELELGGIRGRPLRELHKDSAEHILYHVDDHPAAGSLYATLRRWGGTVILHDWCLPRSAAGAYPELAGTSGRGFLRALREGGWAQARAWREQQSEQLVLNRTVVRLADGFFVFEPQMARTIVEERRCATPVGCLLKGDLAADPTGTGNVERHLEAAAGRFEELATDLLRHLDTFPTHRTARKSVIRSAIDDADRRRLEKAKSEQSESNPG